MLSTVVDVGPRVAWTVPKLVVPSSLTWCLLVCGTVVVFSGLPLRRTYVLCSPIALLPRCRLRPGLMATAWMLKAAWCLLGLPFGEDSAAAVAHRRGDWLD